MKTLKIIGFYFKWLFYFFITQEQRIAYKASEVYGMECEGVRNGIAKFNRYKKPSRKYLTFKEFKLIHYPVK